MFSLLRESEENHHINNSVHAMLFREIDHKLFLRSNQVLIVLAIERTGYASDPNRPTTKPFLSELMQSMAADFVQAHRVLSSVNSQSSASTSKYSFTLWYSTTSFVQRHRPVVERDPEQTLPYAEPRKNVAMSPGRYHQSPLLPGTLLPLLHHHHPPAYEESLVTYCYCDYLSGSYYSE